MKLLTKIGYCLQAAGQNLRGNLLLSCITTSTVAITFILCLSFWMIIMNLAAFRQSWVERIEIIVFLQNGLTAAAIESFQETLRSMPEVASAVFVPRDKALQSLRRSLQGQDGILEGLDENPLPDSIEIRLRQADTDLDRINRFVSDIRTDPAVADIEYGQKWLDRFLAIFEIIRFAGFSLGGCLLLFSYFIVSNTMRLLIYSRRSEIEIMKLVGASRRFIALPFWIEGIVQGVLGALIALVFVRATVGLFLHDLIGTLHFFLGSAGVVQLTPSTALTVIALGGALGFTGSLFSLTSLDEFNVSP